MAMNKKILIRDLTLRDGQQSLFATRMNQEQVERVLGFYKKANFYAMEVWGGAVPDSIMRYLGENPWTRLESIKAEIGDISKLTALSRGRNLFGYNPYPEEVIEGFNRLAVQSGISIMRIFDCLNDINNMKSTIKYVKEYGGMADCAVCFTVDPKFTTKQKIKALLKGKRLPKNIFSIKYFVDKAKELEELGADIITIKDMAGLIKPSLAGKLIRALKEQIKVPIDLHTHCTPGYGLASVLMAIINGVDIVDTNIFYFAGGPAAPAFELIQIFADKLGVDTGVNREAVSEINKELKVIREELRSFDTVPFPNHYDIVKTKLPEVIDVLFDQAIDFAKQDNEEELLRVCNKIEKYFNFPAPNEAVRNAEIPGGMYTNMLAQLKQLKLDHLLDEVLTTVPQVRLDCGCPPLVTPSSQIVGVQAVNCVIDKNKNNEPYTTKSTQFVNLVKGSYGQTPLPIDSAFREQITGMEEEIPYDTSAYQKQVVDKLADCDNISIADNEKEELLLELFPAVARPFLTEKKRTAYKAKVEKEEKERKEKYLKEKSAYDSLTPQEKEERLVYGLLNYWNITEEEAEKLKV